MHDFRSQSIASNTTIVPDCFMPIAIRVFDGICYFGCLIRWCDFRFSTCLVRMLVLSEFKPVGSEDVFSTAFLHQFFGNHFLADQFGACVC